MEAPTGSVRVDRWLWAARLVKTRPIAVEAVTGGRVRVDDQRVKPSTKVRIGDVVAVSLGQGRRVTVVVAALSDRRGSATEAALLYQETSDSREARERHDAERRLAGAPRQSGGGRPTKRDRRRFDATPGSRGGAA